MLPAESPYLYGLHPNAEIGFLTATSDNLFRTVLEMQPRDAGAGSGGGQTREEKVGYYLLHRDPQGSFLFKNNLINEKTSVSQTGKASFG